MTTNFDLAYYNKLLVIYNNILIFIIYMCVFNSDIMSKKILNYFMSYYIFMASIVNSMWFYSWVMNDEFTDYHVRKFLICCFIINFVDYMLNMCINVYYYRKKLN